LRNSASPSFYKTIPNGALKPEKSNNFEFGARARLDQLTLDATVFTGKFKDLIEDSRQISGAGTAANPTVFQSVNIDNATISGFEVKGSMDWGKVGMGKLSTPFSYGQARGKVDNTGLPLDSVDPAKLSLGVRYEAAVWDIRLNATHHAAKKASDIGQQLVTLPLQCAVPASTTYDLSGQWRFTKTTRLNASVANLTNQKYWNWSSVRGVASNAVALAAYSQPGRKINVSLVTEF
jgi:hemoglobin/transferrin/lactoferrin receptor protein